MNTYTKYFPYALISSYNFRVQKSEKKRDQSSHSERDRGNVRVRFCMCIFEHKVFARWLHGKGNSYIVVSNFCGFER